MHTLNAEGPLVDNQDLHPNLAYLLDMAEVIVAWVWLCSSWTLTMMVSEEISLVDGLDQMYYEPCCSQMSPESY